MKRYNKQIELSHEKVNIVYGSTNRYDPKVLYVNCKWWCECKRSKNNKFLEDFMKSIKKKFKTLLLESDAFETNSLFIPIEYLNGMEMNERKYLFFDLYLKQPSTNIVSVIESKKNVEALLEPLLSYMIEELDRNEISVMKNKCN